MKNIEVVVYIGVMLFNLVCFFGCVWILHLALKVNRVLGEQMKMFLNLIK